MSYSPSDKAFDMKAYKPEALVAVSRYQNTLPTLSKDVQTDVYARMAELIEEEKEYCDKLLVLKGLGVPVSDPLSAGRMNSFHRKAIMGNWNFMSIPVATNRNLMLF